jgi:hypothetical protein
LERILLAPQELLPRDRLRLQLPHVGVHRLEPGRERIRLLLADAVGAELVPTDILPPKRIWIDQENVSYARLQQELHDPRAERTAPEDGYALTCKPLTLLPMHSRAPGIHCLDTDAMRASTGSQDVRWSTSRAEPPRHHLPRRRRRGGGNAGILDNESRLNNVTGGRIRHENNTRPITHPLHQAVEYDQAIVGPLRTNLRTAAVLSG